jgi:hypothetical protein
MVTSFVHRPLSLVEATPVAQPAGLVVNPGIQPGTLGCGIDPFIQPWSMQGLEGCIIDSIIHSLGLHPWMPCVPWSQPLGRLQIHMCPVGARRTESCQYYSCCTRHVYRGVAPRREANTPQQWPPKYTCSELSSGRFKVKSQSDGAAAAQYSLCSTF